MNRRDFLTTAAGATAWLSTRPPRGHAPAGALVYVGSYTDEKRPEGIHRFRIDPHTGVWHPAGSTDAGPNPSFLALHPLGTVLYAVNEIEQYEGAASGALSAFVIERQSGDLTLLARHATHGGAPCYVSVDWAGRFALVANYVGGNVALFPLGPDGRPSAATRVEQHTGSGPKKDRQAEPHAHCIRPDPSGQFALSTDLGTDQILVYTLNGPGAPLTPAAVPFIALPPGSGPRHLAFHPAGRFVYATDELSGTISAFRFDPRTGALTAVQTVPAVRESGPGERLTADLHVAPSGRFLYASVRGVDVISVFAINQATGMLTPVQQVSTGGHWPRNFGLVPSGRALYVANQRSDSIVGFAVDTASGRLTPNGVRVEVPMPVCIRFAGRR